MSEPKTIADLRPDPHNARRHTVRNLAMIEKALGEVGAARSIVIDEDGMVLAGNGVIEAAANVDITKLQIIDADGETIIAVRRKGLTPEQKTKLALFDNRASELAEWEPVVLGDIGKNIDLGDLWNADELAQMGVDLSGIEFKEYDESVADEVEYLECPKCGHKWPK